MKGEFSQYLGIVRQQVGMAQAELSRQAGLNTSHINRLESGKRNPPKRDSLLKIAQGLGLDEERTSLLFLAAGYRAPSTYGLPDEEVVKQMANLRKKLNSVLSNAELDRSVSRGYGIFE